MKLRTFPDTREYGLGTFCPRYSVLSGLLEDHLKRLAILTRTVASHLKDLFRKGRGARISRARLVAPAKDQDEAFWNPSFRIDSDRPTYARHFRALAPCILNFPAEAMVGEVTAEIG